MSQMERLNNFLKDVRVEIRKVTWPTREELTESTTVVLVTVLIISAFIFVVDWAVGKLITVII